MTVRQSSVLEMWVQMSSKIPEDMQLHCTGWQVDFLEESVSESFSKTWQVKQRHKKSIQGGSTACCRRKVSMQVEWRMGSWVYLEWSVQMRKRCRSWSHRRSHVTSFSSWPRHDIHVCLFLPLALRISVGTDCCYTSITVQMSRAPP